MTRGSGRSDWNGCELREGNAFLFFCEGIEGATPGDHHELGEVLRAENRRERRDEPALVELRPPLGERRRRTIERKLDRELGGVVLH